MRILVISDEVLRLLCAEHDHRQAANLCHARDDGEQPVDRTAQVSPVLRGQLGTPAEYLLDTVRGLVEPGVRDPYLLELRKRLLAIHPELSLSRR